MIQFYVETIADGVARLAPEDAHHALRVLRMQPGDEAAVVCGGARYLARLSEGGDFRVLSALPSTEARTRVTVYQGIAKGERMDYAVQKCGEIGVAAFVPVNMGRCVATANANKLARWRRIAKESGQQAQRTAIMPVADALDFSGLIAALARHEQALILWEAERALSLRAAYLGARDVALVIGPEGGIAKEERERLPAQAVTLGRRILRTETAGPVAAACVLLLAGDMA